MQKPTLSIHELLSTELERCINEVIILFPLADPLALHLNGARTNIYSGIIINNGDIYQVIEGVNVVEVRIPLSMLLKREESTSHCYFDYNKISSPRELKSLILRDVEQNTVNRVITTTAVLKLLDFLLLEAKVNINSPYLPEITTDLPLLNKILEFTNDHIYESVSPKMIAKEFFISQSYISIIFAKHLNMNFKTYANSLKIALSLRDLIEPDMQISEVATKYNFQNIATFSKQFKYFLHEPPKQFVFRYKVLVIRTKNPLIVKVANYARFVTLIESFSQHSQSSNVEEIDLDNLVESRYIHPIDMMIKVDNLHKLKYYTQRIETGLDAEIFQRPHFIIQNFNVEDANHFNTYDNIQSLIRLSSKHGHVILKISKVNTYYRLEEKLKQLIWGGTLSSEVLRHLVILFDSESLSVKTISVMRRRAIELFPDLQFAMVIDHYLFHHTQQEYFIDTLKSLDLMYYFVDSDLKTLHDKLIEIDDNFHVGDSLREALIQFINLFGKDKRKMVFSRLTHSTLRAYFQSKAESSYTLPAKFYVDLCQYIGGLAFDMQSTERDAVKLLNAFESYRPIVHIYSLLTPFIDKQVMSLPYGLMYQSDQKYHVLLFGGYRFDEESDVSLVVKIHHAFTRDFLLFTRTLNNNYGTIDTIIQPHLQTMELDPQIAKHVHESNHPKTEFVRYEWAKPLEIQLSYQTLKYLSITTMT